MAGRTGNRLDPQRGPSVRRLFCIGIGTVGLAIISTAYTTAGVVARAQPALALQLNGASAAANEAMAEMALQANPDLSQPSTIEPFAKAAILREVPSPRAVRILGLLATTRGDVTRGQRLMNYGQFLSRRDPSTQLFLLESEVQKGDVGRALEHFDIAMRVDPDTWPTLFPILWNAAKDVTIAKPLAARMGPNPVWAQPFLTEGLQANADPGMLATVLVNAERRGFNADTTMRRTIISRLADKNIDNAFRLYRIFVRNPNASAGDVRDLRLSNYPPFDWSYRQDSDVGAELADGGGGVHYYASPGNGGLVANQTLVLRTGRYELTTVGTNVSDDVQSGPTWTVWCGSSASAPLARLNIPTNRDAGARVATQFNVPQNCPFVLLRLDLRASQGTQGLDGYIRSVGIRRLAGN